MTTFFKSYVATFGPEKPASYTKNGESKTLEEIVGHAADELSAGASFHVNPLLASGHTQTAYTALNKFENRDAVHYKRRLVTVESDKKTYTVKGDTMPYDRWEGTSTFAVDYVVPKGRDPDHEQFRPESQKHTLPPRTEYLDPSKEQGLFDDEKPLVVALHGLAGGSYELYLRAFMFKVTKLGFDGLVLNARGCANHTITSPQLFCALWTNDLRYLVNEHLTLWPNKKIFLVGFSLGGSIIANYLGQEGSEVDPRIRGAAIMGSPWDFPQASTALVDSYLGSTIYLPKMCQNLLRLLDQHYEKGLDAQKIVAEYKNNPDLLPLKNLRDFDDAFTARLFGFNSAQEYYRHALPDQRLLNVRVPMLIVLSLDDPIVGSKSLPKSEVKLNPYTLLVTTTIGGHLGWFDWRNNRWYAEPLARVFEEWARWDVVKLLEETLPRATHGAWKHDRIVQ